MQVELWVYSVTVHGCSIIIIILIIIFFAAVGEFVLS